MLHFVTSVTQYLSHILLLTDLPSLTVQYTHCCTVRLAIFVTISRSHNSATKSHDEINSEISIAITQCLAFGNVSWLLKCFNLIFNAYIHNLLKLLIVKLLVLPVYRSTEISCALLKLLNM